MERHCTCRALTDAALEPTLEPGAWAIVAVGTLEACTQSCLTYFHPSQVLSVFVRGYGACTYSILDTM